MALTKIKADGLTADLIDETKLADNSIDSEHYNDGSIDEAHIADDAVTADKLANAINTDIAAKAVLTGSTNNTITTVTGANAIQGEANLTYDGTTLKNQVAAENGTIAQFELSGQTNNPALLIKADESDQQITFRAGASTSTYPSIAFDMGTVGDSVVIQNNGNLTVSDGDLVIGTSGHGIDFSATSGPTNTTGTSDTSELLDDYEEGTFTPIFYKGTPGSNSQPSYNFQYGSYTKIGNMVTVRFSIGFANSGTYSECHIGGMPYSLNLPSNHFYYYQLNGYSWASGYSNSGGDKSLYLFLTADSNSTAFSIKKEDDKPAAGEEAIGSSQRFTGEFSYRTA